MTGRASAALVPLCPTFPGCKMVVEAHFISVVTGLRVFLRLTARQVKDDI